MDSKDLKQFAAVYEQRSIHQAAKSLYISPQGLSKCIGNLEQELEVSLFLRTQKGVEPTECGHYLYEKSTDILREIQITRHRIRQIARREQGLRIACANGVLNALSFSLLSGFMKRYPALDVEWAEYANNEVAERVTSFGADVGLMVGPSNSGRLLNTMLDSRRIVFLVHPGHPLYDRQEISVSELSQERIVTLNRQFQVNTELRRACRDCGFEPNIVGESADSHFVIKLCKMQVGVGVLVDFSVDGFDLEGLRVISVRERMLWDIYLIQSVRDKLPNVRLLQDYLQECLAGPI